MEKRAIAVIGGAGFIGSHLVDKLITLHFPVTVIDDLSTGRLENINKQASFFEMSADSDQIAGILDKNKIRYVFFLAANSNVPLSVRDPLIDFNSLASTLKVLDQCRFSSVKRVIFASSGFIYGNTSNRPIKEDEKFKPVSPYAITKKTIEHYLEFYRKVYNVSYVVLRLATVCGPRQITGALSDYIRKLRGGEQAEFYGDGSKTRDFIYIDDVISAFISCLYIQDSDDLIFNIGSGIELELRDVYNRVALLLGCKPEPIIRPDRAGELYGYSLDSTKAKNILSWEPTIYFDDGLTRTLNHINQDLDLPFK